MTETLASTVVAEAIDYIVAREGRDCELDALARRAGYEPTYFQKLFRDKVGISPKRLCQYMTVNHAREFLRRGATTDEAAHAAGLSGTGRLYDLFVTCDAVTPGEVQHKGQGLTVTYGYHPTPLGEILVGRTGRGVCYLGFLVGQDRAVPLAKMRRHLPHAAFVADDGATAAAADHIMRIWTGHGDAGDKLRLDLHGTNMQIQVWQALLKIPTGRTTTYKAIAAGLGRPNSSRAVGNAVGANPVSLLIPCHRVIQASGVVNNYGWGSPRKKVLLGLELGAAGAGAAGEGGASDLFSLS
jgi:AraC family transcriptional regulator of adaptative response/methylated-DNA-[protein]-cysteine methyltransferase